MPWSNGTDQIDVVNTAYLNGTLSISTVQAEIRVGATTLAKRQVVIVHNPAGNDTIYYGATGVTTLTGIPISAGETLSFPVGESINVFIIKAGATQTVRIQELS